MVCSVVGGSELRQIMTTGSQCLRKTTEGRPLYTVTFAEFSCGQENVSLLLWELERMTDAIPSQKLYLGPLCQTRMGECIQYVVESMGESLLQLIGCQEGKVGLASGSGALASTTSSANDSLGGLLGLCLPICKRKG